MSCFQCHKVFITGKNLCVIFLKHINVTDYDRISFDTILQKYPAEIERNITSIGTFWVLKYFSNIFGPLSPPLRSPQCQNLYGQPWIIETINFPEHYVLCNIHVSPKSIHDHYPKLKTTIPFLMIIISHHFLCIKTDGGNK